jgi:hypothetical protein
MGMLMLKNSSSDNGEEVGKMDGSFNMLASELYGKESTEGVKSTDDNPARQWVQKSHGV